MRAISKLCSVAVLCLALSVLLNCSDTSSASEGGRTFTLKMHKATGENNFSQLAYECSACTFEQFAAIEVPDGWSKGTTQVILPEGELLGTPTFDGVPSSVDFVDEIPGQEFRLIAKTVSGQLVGFRQNRLVVLVDVMRQTRFRFPAGKRVHELTDPDGNTYVLFGFEVESADFTSPDFMSADALTAYPIPTGWTYSTYIPSTAIILESKEIATVLSITGTPSSVWQKR
ncbi:MAG: hypothetical protein VX223_12795 [Myxococcota bacterium]|nr:hypothetical protein [Myxococcota bacterium]